MEYHDLKEKTDDELVIKSASAGPYAELLRRNTEALKESKKSADRSSGIMFDLTLILMVIAIIQMVAAIFSLEIKFYLKFIITIGVLTLLGLLFKDFIRDWRKDKD